MPQKSLDYRAALGEVIVGREAKMRSILTHIHSRKSLHLYGPEGSGKSALLDWAYTHWKDVDCSPVPIYCRSSRTLRQMLVCISGFLLNYFKHLKSIDKFKRIKEIASPTDIKKLNVRTLKNVISSYILEDNFFVILDHLEYVTPRINSFLTTLYEKVPVISASRQSWELSDYAFPGNLGHCLYLTPKLRVENLSKQDTFLLIKSVAGDTFEIGKNIFNDIYLITRGNPGLTKKIVLKSLSPEYHTKGNINLKLIMLDLKIEGTAKTKAV